MKLVIDPAVTTKIERMQQRVRWQHPLVVERQIDQTRLVLDDGRESANFSFLVLGDSGSGPHRGYHPQRQVAELLLPHLNECRFTLHTGDVVYLLGAREYYRKNFIAPYREWLVDSAARRIDYNQMRFEHPFLPVPGNHDYYDLPPLLGLLSLGTLPLRRLLESRLDLDVGWHGSNQGDAYAHAFLDYLKNLKTPADLIAHLEQHYTASSDTVRCLRYQPGRFTRLPNRYYQFRYGGIDFFALDSNTWNQPDPLPKTGEGATRRKQLRQHQQELQQEKYRLLNASIPLQPDNPDHADQVDDLHTRLSQLEEQLMDIDKLLQDDGSPTDWQQLQWLEQGLIRSWQNPEVRGRVLWFHHPPYVTEATKWYQGQTLAVRQRLRQVLAAVATAVGSRPPGRGVVDLVLNGHAHCLEHLQTLATGEGDEQINWVICGGSGFSLRRQRPEGPDLLENLDGTEKLVAQSRLFVGRSGRGSQTRRPYSGVRVDVSADAQPQFSIQPLIAEWYKHQWQFPQFKPLELGKTNLSHSLP